MFLLERERCVFYERRLVCHKFHKFYLFSAAKEQTQKGTNMMRVEKCVMDGWTKECVCSAH